MTLTAQTTVLPGRELDADLVDVARAVHEEFDSRLEPGVVDQCLQDVAAWFADARVRSFVPLLVRRYATDALRTRAAAV